MEGHIQGALKGRLKDVRIVWDNLEAMGLNLTGYLGLKATLDLRNFLFDNPKVKEVLKRYTTSKEKKFDIFKPATGKRKMISNNLRSAL